MREALDRHDEFVEASVGRYHGPVVRPRGEGDSRFAIFDRAADGVAAATALQHAHWREPWATPTPLRVRIGLHTGETESRDGDYYGSAPNRCARLRGMAHGGQALCSRQTAELARPALPPGVSLRLLGSYRLKGLCG